MEEHWGQLLLLGRSTLYFPGQQEWLRRVDQQPRARQTLAVYPC